MSHVQFLCFSDSLLDLGLIVFAFDLSLGSLLVRQRLQFGIMLLFIATIEQNLTGTFQARIPS